MLCSLLVWLETLSACHKPHKAVNQDKNMHFACTRVSWRCLSIIGLYIRSDEYLPAPSVPLPLPRPFLFLLSAWLTELKSCSKRSQHSYNNIESCSRIRRYAIESFWYAATWPAPTAHATGIFQGGFAFERKCLISWHLLKSVSSNPSNTHFLLCLSSWSWSVSWRLSRLTWPKGRRLSGQIASQSACTRGHPHLKLRFQPQMPEMRASHAHHESTLLLFPLILYDIFWDFRVERKQELGEHLLDDKRMRVWEVGVGVTLWQKRRPWFICDLSMCLTSKQMNNRGR